MKVPSKTRAHGGLFLHFIFYFLFFANLLSVYSSFHYMSFTVMFFECKEKKYVSECKER